MAHKSPTPRASRVPTRTMLRRDRLLSSYAKTFLTSQGLGKPWRAVQQEEIGLSAHSWLMPFNNVTDSERGTPIVEPNTASAMLRRKRCDGGAEFLVAFHLAAA